MFGQFSTFLNHPGDLDAQEGLLICSTGGDRQYIVHFLKSRPLGRRFLRNMYLVCGVGVAKGATKLMLLDIPRLPRRQLTQGTRMMINSSL